MSHIAEVKVEFKDMDALKAACVRCGAEFIGMGTHQVYAEQRQGVAFKPKGWHYPVVLQGSTAAMDNFNGYWGEMSEFNRVKQMYAVEVAKKAAKRQGMSITERKQADGSIRLVCAGR